MTLVLVVALLVVCALTARIADLHGQLSELNQLVARMLSDPEKASLYAAMHARYKGWEG